MATKATDMIAAQKADLPEAEFLRRKLRIELTEARSSAKLTQKTMAKELDWSISKVARIEQGAAGVAPSDVRAMLSLFGAKEERIEELVRLARSAREAKSWSEYEDILSPAYRELIGQEAAAASIIKYEPAVFPGLFQTRRYARALLDAQGVATDQAIREAEIRDRRQAILELDGGPELNVVLGEIALVRPVGSDVVMREQFDRLLDLSRQPRISIFLLPFSAGAHAGMGIPFTILQFLDPALEDTLYLEDGTRKTSASEERELVESHLERFRLIEELAESSGTLEEHVQRISNQLYRN